MEGDNNNTEQNQPEEVTSTQQNQPEEVTSTQQNQPEEVTSTEPTPNTGGTEQPPNINEESIETRDPTPDNDTLESNEAVEPTYTYIDPEQPNQQEDQNEVEGEPVEPVMPTDAVVPPTPLRPPPFDMGPPPATSYTMVSPLIVDTSERRRMDGYNLYNVIYHTDVGPSNWHTTPCDYTPNSNSFWEMFEIFRTALMLASLNNRIESIKLLLEQKAIDVNAKDIHLFDIKFISII
ncbi:hypothetical protein GPJ56_010267 [Histomonas meleagridis]|nr:hypothetical protein GPJ56_010267 [Histomonas meleagridis]